MNIYIKPEITVLDIETEKSIAVSGLGDAVNDNKPSVDNDDNMYAKPHHGSLWNSDGLDDKFANIYSPDLWDE